MMENNSATVIVRPTWFQNHLNWTFALVSCALPILFTALMFAVSHNNSWDLLFVTQVVLSLLLVSLVFGVGAWVLYKKRQSNWFILTLFLGLIGIIVILSIDNKRGPRQEENFRTVGRSTFWGITGAWFLFGLQRIISDAPIRPEMPPLPAYLTPIPAPIEPGVMIAGNIINLFFFLFAGIAIGAIAFGAFSLIFNNKLRQSPLIWFWAIYTLLAILLIFPVGGHSQYPDFIGLNSLIITVGVFALVIAGIIYGIALAITKATHRT